MTYSGQVRRKSELSENSSNLTQMTQNGQVRRNVTIFLEIGCHDMAVISAVSGFTLPFNWTQLVPYDWL